MNVSLDESYRHCSQLARQAASNFYFAFFLLPRHKRLAMFALYAFLRRTDDLGDSEETVELRREKLGAWRGSLTAALAGDFHDPLLPALADTVRQFEIPREYLFAVIRGVEMDLEHVSPANYAELENYCHHVASVVGLACIHIWGFSDPRALALAETCGQAFQLTNILRDLREDVERARIYLPQDDLIRFSYSAADLRAGIADHRFRRLMAYEVSRAAKAYAAAAPLYGYLSKDGQRVFAALCGTYYRLLQKIYLEPERTLHGRVRLTSWEKTRIACASAIAPCWTMAADIGQRSQRLSARASARAESP